MYLNYRLRSTAGWNMHNVALDFGGGLLSLVQLLLDGAVTQNWTAVTGAGQGALRRGKVGVGGRGLRCLMHRPCSSLTCPPTFSPCRQPRQVWPRLRLHVF